MTSTLVPDARGIYRAVAQSEDGNTVSFFYNPKDNTMIIYLLHKNEKEGIEVIRKTINEKRFLRHMKGSL